MQGFRNKLNKGAIYKTDPRDAIDALIHKFVRQSHAFIFVAKTKLKRIKYFA